MKTWLTRYRLSVIAPLLLALALCSSVQIARSTPITYTFPAWQWQPRGRLFRGCCVHHYRLRGYEPDRSSVVACVQGDNSATTISISGVGAGTLLTNSVTLDFKIRTQTNPARIFLFYQDPAPRLAQSAFQNYELNASLHRTPALPGFPVLSSQLPLATSLFLRLWCKFCRNARSEPSAWPARLWRLLDLCVRQGESPNLAGSIHQPVNLLVRCAVCSADLPRQSQRQSATIARLPKAGPMQRFT